MDPRRLAYPVASLMVAAALACSLSACSAYRLRDVEAPPIQPFQPPPTPLGKVCIIRTSAIAIAITFLVRDNGHLMGATRGSTYFCYLAEPGVHVLESDSDDKIETVRFAVAPAQRMYLHQGVVNALGWVSSDSSWVDDKEAYQLMSESTYAVLSAVPAEERLPAPIPTAPAAR